MTQVVLANALVEVDEATGLIRIPSSAFGGSGDIKTKRILLTLAGNDQVVLAAMANVAYQIVELEINTDTAVNAKVHFGALASIATKAIGGGYFPANGGLVKPFGTFGPMGAANEAINASVSALANVEIVVQYIERAA